ncbi:MAG TPA: efflux RND transporter periplasmic adaptor subunit [Cyclobacteriaceae bacterium]
MIPYRFYLFVLFVILFLSSCADHSADHVQKTDPIPDSLISKLQTAQVQLENEYDIVKLNGKVLPNETKLAKVYALVSGKIESLNVELGDYVKKGQVLAILKSSEVASISNEVALAEANVTMAKKGLETTKDLYDARLATEQDFLNAKVNYNKMLSELSRAEEVASITGADKSTYVLKSPISGFIVEKNITNNSEVRSDNSDDLFEIADLSTVWVIAHVYESNMYNVHVGDSVRVKTLANPNRCYKGNIDKIYNVLDVETRTMQVRISMPNASNELKPEMFATVVVSGRPTGKRLTVPSKSLVMENSTNYVILKKKNKLSVQEIKLLKRVGDKAYISGLTEGDVVVTSSQVFLYQALTTN